MTLVLPIGKSPSAAQMQKATLLVPNLAAPVQPAPYGAGPSTTPDYTLSPICPASGNKTSGFQFLAFGTDATTLTVWKRDPGTGIWGQLVLVTSLTLFRWINVCGVNACELYFQTNGDEAAGFVLIEETSGG